MNALKAADERTFQLPLALTALTSVPYSHSIFVPTELKRNPHNKRKHTGGDAKIYFAKYINGIVLCCCWN